MPEFIRASEGDLFVQDDPSVAFEHLTCTQVGDLPFPQGDLTPVYCPNPAQKGRFIIEGFIRGEAGAATTTLQKPLSNVANWLLEASEEGCEFNGWIPYGCAGERGNAENWDLGVILFGMMVSNSSILASAVAAQPADEARVNTSADLSYMARMMIYLLRFDRQGVDNTADANAVAFLPMRCADRCGPARRLCAEGYMALSGSLYDSEVKYTTNGGVSWDQVTTGPFALGGSVSDLVLLEVSAGHRAIFSRGSSTAGVGAEVSIYEAFTKVRDVYVPISGIAGQTIQALYAYGGRVWAAASGGYIYLSTTSGDMWSEAEAANETDEDLNDISMYTVNQGYAVGDNNVVLVVQDGSDWNAETGPAANTDLLSVDVNHAGHVFIGAADASLYVSEDEGNTYEVDRQIDFGSGSIDYISFPDKTMRYAGMLIHNDANGIGWVYRTKDGGVTWQMVGTQLTAWNSGLNGGFMCDQNKLVVVGNVHEGTTFIGSTSVVGA